MTFVWISFPCFFLLLLISAFFSASETAFINTSRPFLKRDAKGSKKPLRRALWLLDHNQEMIVTILLGNNLVNILASSLMTALMIRFFGTSGIAIATMLVTILVFLFGEVLPKTYALAFSHRFVIYTAGLLYWPVRLLLPLTRHFSSLPKSSLDAEATPRSEWGEEQAENMTQSFLAFQDLRLSEIGHHRTNLLSLPLDASTEALLEAFATSRQTDIPFYDPQQTDILLGLISEKDFLKLWRNGKPSNLKDHLRPPWFVPETISIIEQMDAFERRDDNMALLVDEHGTLTGFVERRDILHHLQENLALSQNPETLPLHGVWRLSHGRFVVEGHVLLHDLQRNLHWPFESEESSTIAGFLLESIRMIPQEGQIFKVREFQFEVLRKYGHRIGRLLVTPPRS